MSRELWAIEIDDGDEVRIEQACYSEPVARLVRDRLLATGLPVRVLVTRYTPEEDTQ